MHDVAPHGAATPSVPRPRFRAAAVVVLVRGRPGLREVYWVRRSDAVPTMPGFHAFLGGGVNAADAAFGGAIERPHGGPEALDGFEPEALATLEACAIRETFEEAGVLLGAEPGMSGADLADVRRRALEGAEPFAAPRHGWRFRAGALAYIGRWTTPPFSTARFDSAFFLAELPAGQLATVIPGELASGEWIEPRAALALWRRGEATFAAPMLHVMLEFDRAEQQGVAWSDPAVIAALRAAPQRAGLPVRRIELKWGVVLHPTATRPLPPATHTNTYLIGDRDVAIVDPGSADPVELDALFAVTDALAADGRTPACVIVTHHHPDHAAGAAAVCARYGVPLYAHPESPLAMDRVLLDGDLVPLASTAGDWSLRVLHTPGHTRDHLCLYHAGTRSLFTGDLIPGGTGTVIIDPPDGDMAEYLASLERLLGEELEWLFPAHGSPQGAAPRRIRALLAHRREREARVLAALEVMPLAPNELVERAYADTPRELWKYAERSLLAHLLLLERHGRAARDGERWRIAAAR